MNPLQAFVLAFAGLLVLVIVSNFLIELRGYQGSLIDRLDLENIMNLYTKGLLNSDSFSIVYEPKNNGTLIIEDNLIKLNKAETLNHGLPAINCDYDKLLINEGGLSCLKY